MKQWLKTILPAVALLITVASCERKDPEPTDVGGKGGNATLKVTAQHHGMNIDSCTIYIKYNTLDLPADKKFDDSAVCVKIGDKPVATFKSLKKGKYYIFGKGWDPDIAQGVEGGGPYTISSEAEIDRVIAVTEGD